MRTRVVSLTLAAGFVLAALSVLPASAASPKPVPSAATSPAATTSAAPPQAATTPAPAPVARPVRTTPAFTG